MLSCRDLVKTYTTERGTIDAVRALSLEVADGSYTAVIGRSGSGKSSLMSMIGGLSRPSAGSVRVDGTDIWSLSDDGLADFRNRRIGYVFQAASLLPALRLIDNVALPAVLGRRRDVGSSYDRAAGLLARFGLSGYVDAYPAEVSAGEQRRASIARALINAPQLLLADEPTSDLDEQTEIEIMAELVRINRDEGTTLVLVTHNLELAGQADRLVHIADGSLVQ